LAERGTYQLGILLLHQRRRSTLPAFLAYIHGANEVFHWGPLLPA
jgi:hypothetical protein